MSLDLVPRTTGRKKRKMFGRRDVIMILQFILKGKGIRLAKKNYLNSLFLFYVWVLMYEEAGGLLTGVHTLYHIGFKDQTQVPLPTKSSPQPSLLDFKIYSFRKKVIVVLKQTYRLRESKHIWKYNRPTAKKKKKA